VSLINTNRTTDETATIGARAKDAAAQAVPMGKRAGTAAVLGVRQGAVGAKEWAAPRVQIAVRGAREWTAPRLEDAADAVTILVAPRVSSTHSARREIGTQASVAKGRAPGRSVICAQ